MFPILIDFHFLSSVILSQACDLWIGFPHSVYLTGCWWNFFQEDCIGWEFLFFCCLLEYENNTCISKLLHTLLIWIKCLKNSIDLCCSPFSVKNLVKKYVQQVFIYYSFYGIYLSFHTSYFHIDCNRRKCPILFHFSFFVKYISKAFL